MFWVGNFDHQLRKYDMRMLQMPLAKINTGGSIWRILRKNKLIVVSMSGPNKTQIYRFGSESDDFELQFEDAESHGSMVYGVDFLEPSPGLVDLWSCSFYDGLLLRQSVSLQ